jgi:predicted Abi (CAAX) family protease
MPLPAYIANAPARLWRSLVTPPRARDLAETGASLVILAVLVVPAGLATGLLMWRIRPLAELAPMALAAFFAPGLGEELPFRGLLVPDRSEAIGAAWPIAGSTALFCLWHVLEAETFIPQARGEFLRADFLVWTVMLGLGCAILRRRSGSIWPAVLLHWIAVVAWEGWLGGPGF